MAVAPPDPAPASRPASWKKRLLFKALRFWPPYLGAGVRVTRMAKDLSWIEVALHLRPWNRNYVGTHFGGSLYAMADPFYMLLLLERLGPGYIVWDKAASIRYRTPGRGTVTARFEMPDAEVARIRAAADAGEVVEPVFTAALRDAATGEVVAEVEKVLHVRRKNGR